MQTTDEIERDGNNMSLELAEKVKGGTDTKDEDERERDLNLFVSISTICCFCDARTINPQQQQPRDVSRQTTPIITAGRLTILSRIF